MTILISNNRVESNYILFPFTEELIFDLLVFNQINRKKDAISTNTIFLHLALFVEFLKISSNQPLVSNLISFKALSQLRNDHINLLINHFIRNLNIIIIYFVVFIDCYFKFRSQTNIESELKTLIGIPVDLFLMIVAWQRFTQNLKFFFYQITHKVLRKHFIDFFCKNSFTYSFTNKTHWSFTWPKTRDRSFLPVFFQLFLHCFFVILFFNQNFDYS